MAKPLFNNHPLGPKDKPMLLDESTIGCFIYPDATPETLEKLDYSDLNRVYFSTEGLTVCTMDIGPGGFFNPPDYHPGDEMYYILKGTITQYCPTTGQVIRVKAGESLLIPKGTIHVAYNFEDEDLRVMAVIAPKILAGQFFPTDIEGPKKTFLNPDAADLPATPAMEEPKRWAGLDAVGTWPQDGEKLRENKTLYHISEDRKLCLIHGNMHPVLVKLSIANDFMNVGEYVLPSGSTTCRVSDMIEHVGESFLYAVDDQFTVYLPDYNETYIVYPGQMLFMPPHTKHVLLNYIGHKVTIFFGAAPVK